MFSWTFNYHCRMFPLISISNYHEYILILTDKLTTTYILMAIVYVNFSKVTSITSKQICSIKCGHASFGFW